VSGNRQFVRNDDFGNIASSSVLVIPAAGGVPVRVTDDQSLNTSPAWLSRPVSLLYVSNREGGRDLYQVALPRSGRPASNAVRLTTGLNPASVSISADGNRLAYAAYSRTANVWSVAIPPAGAARLARAEPVTTGSQEIEAFDVSADGRWLVFDSDRSGIQQLYRMPLQGGEVEQLTNGPEPSLAPSVSPDGREIGYHSFRNGTRQLFVLPAEGGTPTQVTRDSAQNRGAVWSPDGQSLTYLKDAFMPSQASQIVSRDVAGRWGNPRILLRGGDLPVPAPTGSEVLTMSKEGRMVIVPLTVGAPSRIVQSRRVSAYPGGLIWAWSPDGRFVYYIGKDSVDQKTGIWRVPAAGGVPRLTVWFDEASSYMLRPWFKVRGNRIYFTRGDQQSDVWMTEVR
jgi:TolB protein